MTTAYGWIGLYLSAGTVVLSAYLVWRAIRDSGTLEGRGGNRRSEGTEPRPETWTAPGGEGWSPGPTGWSPDGDEGWSPGAGASGGSGRPRS